MKSLSEKNYEFYMNSELDKFSGEWVAICDEKIIAHGKDLKMVYKEAQLKCPNKRPLLTKVPSDQTLIF